MSVRTLWNRLSGSRGGATPARSTPTQFEALEGRLFRASLGADFALLDEFGVLGLTGSKIAITNPKTKIGGDVGIGPGGVQNFSDGIIDGNLVVDPTANNAHSNNVKITGNTITRGLSPAVAAAEDASSQIAAINPTQTFGNITGSQTIHSTISSGGINVIDVQSIQLNGSAALTLNGTNTDYFVINVFGKFAMTGTSSIKLTGLLNTNGGGGSTHVLFNIVGSGEQVAFTGSSVAEGTFLAVHRDIADSGATVNGVLIGAENHQIAITSGAQVQVNTPHFHSPWL